MTEHEHDEHDEAAMRLFAGPGEMRARGRTFDWASTPLGPVATWPASLCATVRMLLAARYPMILFWGPERVQIYNDAYIPALGGPDRHPAALGMRAADCWTGPVGDIVIPQIDQVRTTGEATWHVDQYVPLPRHGRIEDTFWTYSYGPLFDGDGRAVGVITITQESTAGVRAQRSLTQLIEAAPAVMAVYSGPDHVVTYVNQTWERIVGRPDAIGRPLRDVFPEMAVTGLFAQLDRVYETREPFTDSERQLPIRRSPNGPVEESYWNFVFQPAELPSGSSESGDEPGRRASASQLGIDIICHAIDVTVQVRARRETERLLAESEAARQALVALETQFRIVQDASPDVSLLARAIRDPSPGSGQAGRIVDFRFTYANPATRTLLLGRDEDIVGQTLREAFPESVADGRLEQYRHVVETGALWLADVPYRRGEIAHALRVIAVKVDDGIHLGASDLSARVQAVEERERLLAAERRARAEADAANRAKSEFLAVMSHELRTPLNAIGGYAELLEMGVRGPVNEAQRADLERINRSQRHLLGLINGVLNYAKVDAGAVHYEVGDVPLDEVLATCEALIAPQVRAKGLTLHHDACDRQLSIRADREKVQQIVLNLLSNAVKFTEPGGRIVLRCQRDDGPIDQVRVQVVDTGRGIATEQIERVFQPFVQVDAKLTRTQEGTGLGLAISRDLARGMGGDLTAVSALGVGSTFTLMLPRA